MAYTLTVSQESTVRELLADGEYADEAAVVEHALGLLAERREIAAAISQGHAEYKAGLAVDADVSDARFREKFGLKPREES